MSLVEGLTREYGMRWTSRGLQFLYALFSSDVVTQGGTDAAAVASRVRRCTDLISRTVSRLVGENDPS